MQLDSNFTKITTEEELFYPTEYAGAARVDPISNWSATLEGISVNGEHVYMTRDGGKTPDEAISRLFVAMSEADVSL